MRKLELIFELSDQLQESRYYGNKNTTYSDWVDSHPVYISGWENVIANAQTKLNVDFLNMARYTDASITRYEGNAKDGHVEVKFKTKVYDLISREDIPTLDRFSIGNKIKMSADELITRFDLVPTKLFNSNYIDEYIYHNILNERLLCDDDLVRCCLSEL